MIPLRSRAVILAFLLGFLPVLAPAEEFLLQIGELVTDGAIGATPTPGAGTIDSENPQDIYRFSGTTGQRVYFDSLIPGNCGQFSWYIRMPSGDGLNGGTPDLCSDIGTITLPQTGTYTLYVYALGAGTGTYQFRLMDVDAEAIPIAIGDTVSDSVPLAGAGRLPAPARIQAYTFTGTTGQRVYFDSLIPGSCGQFAWYIRMPSGDGLNGGTPDLCSDIGTIILPQSGTYTLYVYALGTGTGTYQFRIMDVDAEAIPIAIGDTVSDGVPLAGAGRLPAPARIQAYTFTGTTGRRVYFDSLMPSSCGQFAWYIRMPSGDGLNGGTPDLCSDIGTITLPQTGTYTLYVFALGDGTGTYSFKLNSLRAPVAGDDVAATVVDRAVNLPVVRLLANDSDPDLDTLSITLPGNTTQAGGSLALSGGSVQYHPPSGFDGVDTFNYQVEDGLGQTDIGTVTVTVRRPELLGRNTISAARESDGSLRLRMAGIPGRNYQVWFATDLAGVWSELATVAADETGLVQFTDTSAIGIPVRFYRLAETP